MAKAFTLIELLVVVAIIAILAAIAIPNLLEAQTRAKVSRVKSDLRTHGVALEAYRVDWNRYPPHLDLPSDMYPLTTPVAFLTSLPKDPFSKEGSNVYALVGDNYTYQDLVDILEVRNPNWGGYSGAWLRGVVGSGRQWSMSSPGPDLMEDMARDGRATYDPTNGTISIGDVYRLGP